MDEKKILLRLSRHLELIDKLEKLPLTDNVKLSELAGDKSEQVALYKDKKADKFKDGTPVDYLCWIGVCYNRIVNKSSYGEKCKPYLQGIDQFFSQNKYPNCEVRLYFRNPDLFIPSDSSISDTYSRIVIMSLVFAKHYISQRQNIGGSKGKLLSIDDLRKIHDKLGAVLGEVDTS